MGNLSPKEVQVLGSAMYSVQGLGQDTVNLVLDTDNYKGTNAVLVYWRWIYKKCSFKSLGEDKAQMF